MRQTRNKEAAALLAGRGSEAKKVFQRNSSQGQMNFGAALRKSSDPKPLPGVTGVSKASPPVKPVAEPLKEETIQSKPEPEPESEPANDIAPPPPAFDGSPEPVETKQEDPQVHLHHASPANISASNQEEEEETELPQASSSPNMESYGTCAVALYDYQVRSTSPPTSLLSP